MKYNPKELGHTLEISVNSFCRNSIGDLTLTAFCRLVKWDADRETNELYPEGMPRGVEAVQGEFWIYADSGNLHDDLCYSDYGTRNYRHLKEAVPFMARIAARLEKIQDAEGAAYNNLGQLLNQYARAFGVSSCRLRLGNEEHSWCALASLPLRVNEFVTKEKNKL